MLRRASPCLVFVSALALVLPTPAGAAAGDALPTLRDFSSVRAAGMAGATRGNALGNEALLVNPAAMVLQPRVNFGGLFQYDGAWGTRFWGFDAVDSLSTHSDDGPALAGGLGYYQYASGNGAERREGSVYAFGAAAPISDLLCLGATFKFLDIEGAVSSRGVTTDVAMAIRLGKHAALSGIGYNLIDIDSDEARKAFAAGLGVTLGSLVGDVDLRFDENAAGDSVQTWALGLEYLLGRVFAPRIGFAWDGLRGVRQLGMGASLVFESFLLEAAWRRDLNDAGSEFSVALRAWKF